MTKTVTSTLTLSGRKFSKKELIRLKSGKRSLSGVMIFSPR
ncbi:hypothetical protein [Bathymodiolus platifrons methanotrophic gill symbiont]|nr:hypothetical protein [Bathymodiolus platifrons methanotrophic gill symbiont]